MLIANPKGLLIACLLLFATIISSKATHLMGGEITWTCLGNGNYIFQMKVYRDCATNVPVNNSPLDLTVFNHPTVHSIAMSIVSHSDISPQCNGAGPTYTCASPNGNTAVEEYIIRSGVVSLPGIPPPQGWIFAWSNCCRNSAITNLQLSFNGPGNPSNGFTLRAKMFAYNGQNASPCFDSSPVFQERPNIIICAGTPFTYNPNAYDPDLDSLTYEFDRPLDYLSGNFTNTNPPAIPYELGYTVGSPFPDASQNPQNVPVTLNRLTGEMTFTSFTIGNFVEVIKVTAYKCGQPVAEIYREIQTVILSCGANQPPVVTAPFPNPGTGLYTHYVDTVRAGDLVTFTLTGTETGILPTGYAQTVSFTAQGGMFGTNFTNASAGCDHPPCATLTSSGTSSIVPPNTQTVTFNWQTGCEHISNFENCTNHGNLHTFTFTFKDDYCPAPSYTVVTVSIVVEPIPVIESPMLHCASVLSSGDVELTWLTPLDTAQTFNSYHIYASANPNGPFQVVDSVFNYSQTTYTHLGANANAGSKYYFIKSRSGCLGRVFSVAKDTLQTIFVSISPVVNSHFTVSWNPLHQPELATAANNYTVLKQTSILPWANFAATPILSLPDSLSNCGGLYGYQVCLPDQIGCTSNSNISITNLLNNNPPPDVILDSASVNLPNQLVNLGWEPSPITSVVAYVVFKEINGVMTPIDTVFGIGNTHFTDPNSSPGTNSEAYSVQAIDSCGNASRTSIVHRTILLAYLVNSCKGEVSLLWNPYLGFSVSGYAIYVKSGNQPYTQVANVAGNVQSYTLQNIEPNTNYCIYIRAFATQTGLSASGNEVCFVANSIKLSQFTYMNYATVLDDNTAALKCYVDTAANIVSYRVSRYNVEGTFSQTLTTLPFNPNSPFIYYTDFSASTPTTSYEYKIGVMDACGNESGISNMGRTICLKGYADEAFMNRLNWNYYAQWSGGVKGYNLYACSDKNRSNAYLLASFDANGNKFDHNVADSLEGKGNFCYYVEAFEDTGNIYGFMENSQSNVVCLHQEPEFYIPSAFMIGGKSGNFGPRGIFIREAKKYAFSIWTRWGERIFWTDVPGQDWDGTFKGELVPVSVYVYLVDFMSQSGKYITRSGRVTVIR